MDNWLNIILQSVKHTSQGVIVNCCVLDDTDSIITALQLAVSIDLEDLIDNQEYFETPHSMQVQNETILAIQHNL